MSLKRNITYTRFKKYHARTILKLTELKIKFGLRNNKEISLAEKIIEKARKTELSKNKENITLYKNKLEKYGIIDNESSLLRINVEEILNRRLQTVISKLKGFSIKKSRQKITHGHVLIDGIRQKRPGMLVSLKAESLIKII